MSGLCGLMDVAGTGMFCPVHGWMIGNNRQAIKQHKQLLDMVVKRTAEIKPLSDYASQPKLLSKKELER